MAPPRKAAGQEHVHSASIAPLLPISAPAHRRLARFALRLGQGLTIHNAFGAAPAMAFHFFLSLIPVLVLLGFILGQLVRKRGVEALVGPVLDNAPGSAEMIVRGELERLAGSSAALAPLSVIGFLWVASSGTQGLMDVFELAVGAPRRPWWKQRAIAVVTVLAGLLAVAGVGWGLLKADTMLHQGEAHGMAAPPSSAARPKPPVAASSATKESAALEAPKPRRHLAPLLLQAPWERDVALASLCVIGLCGLALFYRFAVEHPPGVRRRAWPGAIVAFAAWVLLSWGFSEYVSSLGKYTLFYGSVAAVAVLLVWFYLTSWALLVGVEINAQLEGLRDKHRA